MPYIKEVCRAGATIEVVKRFSPRYGKKCSPRGPNENPTPQAMEAVNRRQAETRLRKVEIAIDRLRLYEPIALSYSSKGYYVADSGGKDSTVIKYLAELAGVKYEVAHSHTTADHPETVYFVRREQERIQAQGIEYSIEYPHYKGKRTSIWSLIGIKGLPTRTQRWCCAVCKESSGDGKVVVTGVRWAESNSRKKNRGIAEVQHKKKTQRLILTNDNDNNRREIENCVKKGKRVINPIIDWTTDEVWEFIHLYELPYNPLYDQGYKRVGCVGCPNSDNFTELELNPQYKQMYIRAAARYKGAIGKYINMIQSSL